MRKLLAAVLLALSASVTASAATTYTLTVSTAGPVSISSVSFSSGTTVYTCPSTCSVVFASSAVVTLTEMGASTVAFAGWTGSLGCATNLPTCQVVMTATGSVAATFNPYVSIGLSGVGLGSVTDASGQVKCNSANGCLGNGAQLYAYPNGTSVVFTETAGSSSTFVGWTGDGGCARASTCTVTLNGYETIVATFTSSGPFTISVDVPLGGGEITSYPAGITCGSTGTLCAVAFSSGTSVHLATAASSGYYFSGWANGGCSGKTPCVVVSTSAYQGLGGSASPAAYFYPTSP